MDKGKAPIRNGQVVPQYGLAWPQPNSPQGVIKEDMKQEEAEVAAFLEPARAALHLRQTGGQPWINGDDILFPLARLLQHTKLSAESQNQKPIRFSGSKYTDLPGIQALEVRETRCRAYLQVLCSIDQQMLKNNFHGTMEEHQRLSMLLARRRTRLQMREAESTKNAALRMYDGLQARWQSANQHPCRVSSHRTHLETPFNTIGPLQQNAVLLGSHNTLAQRRLSQSGAYADSRMQTPFPALDPRLQTPTRTGRLGHQQRSMGMLDSFNIQSEAAQTPHQSSRPLETANLSINQNVKNTAFSAHVPPASCHIDRNTSNSVVSMHEPLVPVTTASLTTPNPETEPAHAEPEAWPFDLDDMVDWEAIENDAVVAVAENTATPGDNNQIECPKEVSTDGTSRGRADSIWDGSDAGFAISGPPEQTQETSSADTNNLSRSGSQEEIAQTPMSGRKRPALEERGGDCGDGDSSKRRKQSALQPCDTSQSVIGDTTNPEAEILRLRAIIEGMGKNPDAR